MGEQALIVVGFFRGRRKAGTGVQVGFSRTRRAGSDAEAQLVAQEFSEKPGFVRVEIRREICAPCAHQAHTGRCMENGCPCPGFNEGSPKGG